MAWSDGECWSFGCATVALELTGDNISFGKDDDNKRTNFVAPESRNAEGKILKEIQQQQQQQQVRILTTSALDTTSGCQLPER